MSRASTMSSQDRSTRSSTQTGVCKGKIGPFRRCYCGEEAPCTISWSENNPGRRYYGCKYWPNEKEECGYFDWYDNATTDWYKKLLNDLKSKKKRPTGKGNPNLVVLVRVNALFDCFVRSIGRDFVVDGIEGVMWWFLGCVLSMDVVAVTIWMNVGSNVDQFS
ncbi:hypothetical protein LXL04_029007 [Taraxacum kok-saghyz]